MKAKELLVLKKTKAQSTHLNCPPEIYKPASQKILLNQISN